MELTYAAFQIFYFLCAIIHPFHFCVIFLQYSEETERLEGQKESSNAAADFKIERAYQRALKWKGDSERFSVGKGPPTGQKHFKSEKHNVSACWWGSERHRSIVVLLKPSAAVAPREALQSNVFDWNWFSNQPPIVRFYYILCAISNCHQFPVRFCINNI